MNLLHLKDGVISGMILGDGNLKKGSITLRLCHTAPQREYLIFKLRLAEQLGFGTTLYRDCVMNTNLGPYLYSTGTVYGGDLYRFYTMSFEELVGNINPLGLLLWWLDDGCLNIHQKANGSVSRFGYLNTQSYGLDGNNYIRSKLLEVFGIESTVHIDSKSGLAKSDHYRLYINATNFRRLIDLVREFIPWIPFTMIYKLNMRYVKNRIIESEYLTEHYNF